MHNTYIQLALGLMPAALFFLLAGMIAKRHKFRNFSVAVIFFVTAAVLAGPQVFSQLQEQAAAQNYDKLSLIYAVADEGSVGLAQALLQDERANYQPEHALAAARFAAQDQDYSAAIALYRKAVLSFPEAEGELSALIAFSEADVLYYSVTADTDMATVYQTRTERLSIAEKEISTAVENRIPETDDDRYDKLAKYLVFAEAAHQAYLYGEDMDISEDMDIAEDMDITEIQKYRRRMDDLLEENPGFLAITQVRLARLKLQLLCEDYSSIAAVLDETSDYNELLIVSELYIKNYMKQSDFTGEFSRDNTQKYQTVYDRLNDIYNNSYTDLSREERNEAKAQLQALKVIIRNPALGKMEERLSEYATEEYAVDASKAYLQMAKIEHSLGNETKSAEYIDRSIDTVGDCEDSDYTVPMYELVSIIADKDDPERLKEAAEYVDRVLDNNLTVKLSEQSTAESTESEEEALTGDFATQMQTYVSQKRMSVNIVNVDTTGFEDDAVIKATVNISNNLYTSADELKAAMSVVDCSVGISDFTVEKVDYSGADILLCVDISGSMQGSKIENLKDAIRLFAADKEEIENIALVTFNGEIAGDYPFGLSAEELNQVADSIYAGGNTSVYHSAIYSLEKFESNPGVINSIILMTDGQDGYYASIDEIEEYIGKPCREKGITIYTIGFGSDADGAYLNSIAAATGGTYLYASDPTAASQVNQLEEFFSGLRAQILNQYELSFTADDTLSYSRELKVSVGDGLDSDQVTYYLGGGADSITEPDHDENSPVYMSGKAVYSFAPRMLYKNGQTMESTLKGEGFAAEDNISITLKGNTTGVEWNLGTSFVDANSVAVTIPAGIAVDVYDAYIRINGKTAILTKGIAIFMQGSEQVTDFGQYRFVSYMKHKEEDSVRLSGYVTMNGWLNFNSGISLIGDLNSKSISLMDLDGSYVSYSQENSEGLATVLAKVGLPVSLPALGVITLYHDAGYEKQSGDFKVEVFPLNGLELGKYFMLSQISVKLYPNRAEFDAENILATLPFAGKVLKNKADLFTFDYAFGGSVSSQNIGVKLDISFPVSKVTDDKFFPMNLGNAPIYVSPEDTEIHIDTLANDYEFKFMVKTAFIAGQSALGLSARWDNPDSGNTSGSHSNGLVPTEFKLYADNDIHTSIAGVPVTYSDFMLGIEDIDTSKSPIYWTFVGGCDISAAKLSAIPGMGGLKDWIGDVSVLKLDDAKLSFNLGEFHIKAETSLKLFEELDCGAVSIEMGKFPYTCALLKMDNEPVSGLRFVGTLGPDWRFGKSYIKLQLTGEFDALSKFIGIQGYGTFDAKFKVWIVSIGASVSGEAAVGMRITSDGSTAFVVRTNPALPNGGLTWPKNMAGKV